MDGFKIDTVKHVEASDGARFNEQAKLAYEVWIMKKPKKVINKEACLVIAELYC